jgi:hypothetical protein
MLIWVLCVPILLLFFFKDVLIECWNCSDCVLCFVLHFIVNLFGRKYIAAFYFEIIEWPSKKGTDFPNTKNVVL